MHGGRTTGYEGGGDSLTPAVRVADGLRQTGTRIVGVGIGLEPQSVPNLVQVTGPVAGDDYYQTGADTLGLLDRLYDIASKTCGIPVVALPPPEGGHFPLLPAAIVAVAAVMLAVVGGYLVSRRRSGPVAAAGSAGRSVRNRTKPKDQTIRITDVPSVPTDVSRTAEDDMTPEAAEGVDVVPATRRRPGRMSLDRLNGVMDAQQANHDATTDPRPPISGDDDD